MAEWKKNPVVGVVAGIIFILAMVMMIVLLKPKAPPLAEGEGRTPASTPFVKGR